MLVMPSLIAAIVQQHQTLSEAELLRQVSLIYPMLKSELLCDSALRKSAIRRLRA